MADCDSTAELVLAESKCEECGGDVWISVNADGSPRNGRKRYCSPKCNYRAIGRQRPPRPQSSRKWHDHICKGCGIAFRSQRTDSKHCSRRCSALNNKFGSIGSKGGKKAKISWLPRYTRLYLKKCKGCGSEFLSRVKNKNTCSTACKNSLRGRQYLAGNGGSRKCKSCGVSYSPIYGSYGSVCCSYECQLENDKVNKRKAKARRRARERQAHKRSVSGDVFDPFEVFERDRWRCQSCGCATPKRLRGTLNDNAPQLDHIIPLAKGGDHTMENTQCLCRVCNIMKSDMMPDEFVQWKQGVGRAVSISTTIYREIRAPNHLVLSTISN